jgi:hypothetical protein
MTPWTEKLIGAIAAAGRPGPMFAPNALEERLNGLDNPLGALIDHDAANEMFAILDEDLGYVWPVRQARREYSDDLAQKTAGAIRWLISALSAWRLEDDPKRARLAAILAVGARLDEGGALWPLLPDTIVENVALGGGLVDVLGRLDFRFGVAGWSRSPILHGEQLEQLNRAEAERDWAVLRHYAEGYADRAYGNVVLGQSVRILNRFFPTRIITAGQAVSNLGVALQFATTLSISEALSVATQSANALLAFAAVCRLFNKHDRVREIGPAQEDTLVALLWSFASDAPLWSAWMRAFAMYPNQTELMQRAIGRALSELGESELRAYIDAIYLQSSWVGREDIAACFAAFADRVPLERRRTAWRLMFQRWSEWNFGEQEGHAALTAISLSNVDFAIVGYAVECLTAEDRESYISNCLDVVGRSEQVWHRSHLDHMRYVYRALSRFQPFGHARSCGLDRTRWLWSETSGYYPDQLDDPFWRLRYNLHNMPERKAQPDAASSQP